MFRILILMAMGLIALSGCGPEKKTTDDKPSNSSTEEETQVGILMEGLLPGIDYKTDTHSGVVSSIGEFEYANGELVEFSLGGVVLGESVAQSTLSLEDMFGSELPMDELVIRRSLEDSKTISSFDVMANKWMLLVVLDDDFDSTNGINLIDIDYESFMHGLHFNYKYLSFYTSELYSRLENEGRYLGMSSRYAAVQLYELMGRELSVKAIQSKADDLTNNGILNRSTVYQFDEKGRLAFKSYDGDFDGLIDNQTQYQYNRFNQETSEVRMVSSADDGDFNTRYLNTRTYNSLGYVLSEISEDDLNINDGVIENAFEIDNVYNAHGWKTQYRATEWSEGEVNEIVDVFFTHNTVGKEESVTEFVDSEGDGTIEESYSEFYFYDDFNNVTYYESTYDDGFDGTIDEIYYSEYTYDNSGQQLSYSNVSDYENDGVINKGYYTESEFDDDGRRTRQITRRDNDGDGVDDYWLEAISVYDGLSEPVQYQERKDSDGDGVIDYITVTDYQYDDALNRTYYESKIDNDADGDYDQIDRFTLRWNENHDRTYWYHELETVGVSKNSESWTHTYDENGWLILSEYEADVLMDNDVDRRERVSYRVDRVGNRLDELREKDNDGDGIYEWARRYERTTATIDDGLTYLLSDQYIN